MKIEEIKIKHIVETQPDLSYLGKYSNKPAEICIDRQERGDQHRGEYRYFNPCDDDPRYIERHYERFESYHQQQWCVLGIKADAVVSYPVEPSGSKRLETLSSGGIWGIESDSGDYISAVEDEQVDDLREHLAQFGIVVDDENWSNLCDQAKEKAVTVYDN